MVEGWAGGVSWLLVLSLQVLGSVLIPSHPNKEANTELYLGSWIYSAAPGLLCVS